MGHKLRRYFTFPYVASLMALVVAMGRDVVRRRHDRERGDREQLDPVEGRR
jgi:hypothetical protein